MKVLDKGEVTLLNSMGGDESVIAAARVSNGVEYAEASKGPEKDQRLINYLVKHRHGTPFEHATFQFYIKAPLFVVREWQRHRMASYNEISGRYVEFEPEFYIPDQFRIPAETNKQGSKLPEPGGEIKSFGGLTFPYSYHEWGIDKWQKEITEYTNRITEASFQGYKTLLAAGVAKEMARMVLPLNLYSQFYFTVNARSLMNFLSLRRAEDAQYEIRMYAQGIEPLFAEAMPLTYNAWAANEFIAP